MFIHTTPAVPSVMSGRPVPGAGLPPSKDGSHAARRDNGDDATVIIVDDNAALRQTMAAIFESHGLRVSSFADPRQVLARLDLPRPACLLMDVRLPGMSGLELAQRLRERGERIPVIFLTGFATVDMAVRAMKAGAEDFLEKPADPEILLKLVRQCLGRDRTVIRALAKRAALSGRLASLTPRERQVMDLVMDGRSNRDIAQRLCVGVRTVEHHRARMMGKSGARSLAHLILLTDRLR